MTGRGTSYLAQTSVADAMHAGVYSCPADADLSEVAEIMAERGVHAVVVVRDGTDASTAPGVISDLDLIAAATTRGLDEQVAEGSAASPAITVTPADTLELAAELMTRHATTHLVVVDWPSRRPVGVLSTLDIVTALAGGRTVATPSSR